MQNFADWNLKLKETFNATNPLVVLTVKESGEKLGLSKDSMKVFVEKNNLTKVRINRNTHRYLLLKSEIDDILKKEMNKIN